MHEEPTVDPRRGNLAATQAEIDAWAEREHARRKAWLEGPSNIEKLEWAREERHRAALGWGESSLAPTQEEIDAWAEREHRRRQAWLEGPSEEDKRTYRHRAARQSADLAPTEDEIEEWARRENQRRREWLAGPTEEEKLEWAHRESGTLFSGRLHLPPGLQPEEELLSSCLREAELAGKGTLRALSRVSGALWSYFVHSGRSFEHGGSRPPRRGRVPY